MSAVTRGCPFANEADFQAALVKAAKQLGWLVYHTRFSIDSEPGFPDLIMVRGERLIAAELKGPRGIVSPEQQAWLDKLGQVPGVEAYLWKPQQWDEIVVALERGTRGGSTRRPTDSEIARCRPG